MSCGVVRQPGCRMIMKNHCRSFRIPFIRIGDRSFRIRNGLAIIDSNWDRMETGPFWE